MDTGTTSYDDLSAADGVTDYYEVAAFGLGGDSAPTAVVSATPIAEIQSITALGGQYDPYAVPSYSTGYTQPVTMDERTLLLALDDPNNNGQPVINGFSQPQHGTLSDSGNGMLTYQGDPGFVGDDSFQYTATDQYNAPSAAITVQLQVIDNAPNLLSQDLTLSQAYTYNGNVLTWQAAAQPCLGQIPPNSWIVSGPTPAVGTFQLDSQTGQFTYTPPAGATIGPEVTVVIQTSDGALESNLATLVVPAYSFSTDPQTGEPVMTTEAVPVCADAGAQLAVNENGTLDYSLSFRWNTNFPPGTPPPPVSIGSIITQPQHGALVSMDSAGDFVYQPAPGFVGRDSFTFSTVGAGVSGGYGTVEINVVPVYASLSFPNDFYSNNVIIPSDQFPSSGEAQQYIELEARVYMQDTYPPPAGTQETLSINPDVMNDVDVYNGIPGEAGSQVILGKDAGTDTYTLDASPWPYTDFYVVGLSGTNVNQAAFTLSVSIPPTIYGSPPDNSPDATTQPATQPLTATQSATVPGKSGFLEALDGTGDSEASNTSIRQFFLRYTSPNKQYHRGVGNSVDHPHVVAAYLNVAFGDLEAQKFELAASAEVAAFYNVRANLGIPLDMIGYSRGAMEAVKLINELSSTGVPDYGTKTTVGGNATYTYIHPAVRYVGLISPVMGATQQIYFWPTSLPAGVQRGFQALDNDRYDGIIPQHTIDWASGTHGLDIQYPDGHSWIGRDPIVLNRMLGEASVVGVPIS